MKMKTGLFASKPRRTKQNATNDHDISPVFDQKACTKSIKSTSSKRLRKSIKTRSQNEPNVVQNLSKTRLKNLIDFLICSYARMEPKLIQNEPKRVHNGSQGHKLRQVAIRDAVRIPDGKNNGFQKQQQKHNV
jgi:hypothetical protein